LKKTLAMRLLDQKGIAYQPVVFPETIHDALGVASHAGLPPAMVYKALVALVVEPLTRGKPRPVLSLIAAGRLLDLKKLARAIAAKRVEMAPQMEAERLTGLKVGGISPLALVDRGFAVYLDEPARELSEICVSAGQRGINLRIRPSDLVAITNATYADVSRAPEGPGNDL
jgi:Cys-tRNA(Pro)/Cys-tRNA(Cys) deacylase